MAQINDTRNRTGRRFAENDLVMGIIDGKIQYVGWVTNFYYCDDDDSKSWVETRLPRVKRQFHPDQLWHA